MKRIVETTKAPSIGDGCEYCAKQIKPFGNRFAVVWSDEYRKVAKSLTADELREWAYSNGEIVCSRKCGSELI